MRLLCGSCARLPRLGPLRYQAAACLAVLRYYPGLFAFPAPHRFATLQSCPLLPPAASSYRCVPCSPNPRPGRTGCSRCPPCSSHASLPVPQLIQGSHFITSAARRCRPAAHSQTSATRRCPPRSSRLHLGHTSLPTPQLVASSSTSAPRLRVNARPATHSFTSDSPRCPPRSL